MKTLPTRATLIALTASLLLVGGCASNSELDKMRADITANRDAAARAQATADSAASTAHNAELASREASDAADAASTRVDRMFKKAMYK